MKRTKRHLLGMLMLLMVMTFTVQFSTAQPVYAAKVKSIKYTKKKLLNKVRSYKRSKYPRNKYIGVAYYEKVSKTTVDFYLYISQGDGAPEVGTVRVNRKTGRAKLIYDAKWERVKLKHGSYRLW